MKYNIGDDVKFIIKSNTYGKQISTGEILCIRKTFFGSNKYLLKCTINYYNDGVFVRTLDNVVRWIKEKNIISKQ